MKTMNPAATSNVRQLVSDEEWQVRVDLAACYRLVHHYRMTDLVSGGSRGACDGLGNEGRPRGSVFRAHAGPLAGLDEAYEAVAVFQGEFAAASAEMAVSVLGLR